ncbi:enoyl-CoA hydratase [Sphingobium sp. TA15]|uniref:Phenylacetate degradation protein n=2 Tax=Sphingobium indicum TaxID=332055 RepID=D4YX95_SPHIU|nr:MULTISPECIES: enoyl-CoA hydratase/isomerase family protein [Sphingobium]KEZ00365.1 enoyl-CoA hydratase [Sphingomonas sp. BHC-A]BDD67859.1 enoyl-CoA hydratase [Sphingobium sp. TA15]KER36984.1 phenylacetate degradation protein [Sphingobium indicum F2]NYI23945.1 enoyl-CoA hydratase/carnithine racemase [Sphingobium indicum]BAI94977.1 phenylacetate degradation protein [Sphingobium indicum UT26S]
MSEFCTFELDGNVGVLTFANAPLNLITFPLMDLFDEALNQAALSDMRALIVRSEGPHFCAGADVKMFLDRSEAYARHQFSRALPLIIQRLEELPVPVIAQVQGFCLAAGLEIAMACDIIVAGKSAEFAQVEVHIGASTFLGGIERLATLCGANRAREIVFGGDRYSAEQFERWNIVNRVVEDEQLAEKTMKYARRIASGPTRAHAVSKRLVRAALDDGVRGADRLIGDIAAPLFETKDMQHGVRVLLEHGSRNMIGKAKFEGN